MLAYGFDDNITQRAVMVHSGVIRHFSRYQKIVTVPVILHFVVELLKRQSFKATCVVLFP